MYENCMKNDDDDDDDDDDALLLLLCWIDAASTVVDDSVLLSVPWLKLTIELSPANAIHEHVFCIEP